MSPSKFGRTAVCVSIIALTSAAMDAMADGGSPEVPGRQPSGALTGVTLFCNAGHGWTAGSSAWFLQRPLLLNMVEDYGNLDQLNYFVQLAYNAGATVVPFRPVGYQAAEVVLDNDDATVSFTGSWSSGAPSSGYYENGVTISGIPFRQTDAQGTTTATARYTPTIPADGDWPIYAWSLDGADRVRQTYRIHHTGGTTDVVIDHRMVGRGWVWLGNYRLRAGQDQFVEILNESPDTGMVIADAIRFGNGMGDIVGAGPGRISGYPREEECSRYWAERETRYNAVGMPGTIYDCCSLDSDDNVGAAARWAREMNNTSVNNDRWRRLFVEFHTNANNGSARGTMALVHSDYPTSNQSQYATVLGNEVKNFMTALNPSLEHPWGSTTNPFVGQYGAISSINNSNEFDATILEVAFHDNAQDAELLLSARVRQAAARASLQGMVRFLHGLPGSTVPLALLPDPPSSLSIVHDGNGSVTLSWLPPASGPTRGDPATGYRIFRSNDGRAFDGGLDVGNVVTASLDDLPANQTVYVRVAAYNAGGQSLPSETLTMRHPSSGTSRVLIVNGFDRLDRFQNPTQTIPSGTMQRPMLRKINTFDYCIQHAEALAAAGLTFDSCANEAITNGQVPLSRYDAVVWILGEESDDDRTFDAAEQSAVHAYLAGGGRLLASGSEIGWELVGQNRGVSFYQSVLGARYVGDTSGTYRAQGTAGGIFAGIGAFDFDPSGAPYTCESADRVGPWGAGALQALTYVGGTADGAAIQYDAGVYRVVLLGFPFETITSATVRSEIMRRSLNFLLPAAPVPNDACENATLVNTLPFSADQDTTAAARNPEDPTDCTNNFTGSVWFRFLPPTGMYLDIQTCGSGYDTALGVFRGTCSALVPVAGACDDNDCERQSRLRAIPVNSGAAYYVLVTDAGSPPTGGGDLSLRISQSPDTDHDTVPDFIDNCPFIVNLDQADADLDDLGDPCDPCPSRRIGDVNGDGLTGSGDVADFVAALLAEEPEPTAACAADTNGNGTLDGSDIAGFAACITGGCR